MFGWDRNLYSSRSFQKPRFLFRRRLGSRTFVIPAVIVMVPILCLTLLTLWMGFRHVTYTISHPPLERIDDKLDPMFSKGCKNVALEAQMHPRMNATFVILTRNSDLDGVVSSMKSLEKHFNRHFNYPYTFLNNDPFDQTFMDTVRKHTAADIEFGEIDSEMFGFPSNIDASVYQEAIADQGDRGIMYGDAESYHHMCRFFSGFFYKHPLLLKYQWYWRVEPDVTFTCDIPYDPFYYMKNNGKVYGFVIAIKELEDTVPSLFRYSSAYRRSKQLNSGLWNFFLESSESEKISDNELVDVDSGDSQTPLTSQLDAKMKTLYSEENSNMDGESYNMCHFWSNFEIANFDFFRNDLYEDFFQKMDRTGGFWTERWGDAPFHSLAAGLFLKETEVHYFRDFGYRHSDIYHCGQDLGCNCECLSEFPEVEFAEGGCFRQWAKLVGDGPL
ncbi:mannosyltransferase complex subunit [Schizosaccharomyces octosporus yFS286]|uniref:Mannosyltransferase complex subunit n=1 Tax=Schizosaccharomyces octosporus (strain yFS286) TaxID=483514 RepID=S9RN05_SCHOY|nr:mannosyltransferase complex subunit [Schizosaccharomyces octosporus yFS286]EPX75354.1 mannosyltransferase complex subunit [Schizosaccharomyces octosporus yFS286]